MKLNKITTILGVSLAALTLGACSSNHSSATTTKDTLVVGLEGSIPTLDTAKISDTTSARVTFDLFEGLTSEDQSNRPVPGVAKSWDISPDGKTYTFHLRDNAKWSNGKPVTAQDFVFALRREVTPKTAAEDSYELYGIVNAKEISKGGKSPDTLGVKALDAHTVQIKLLRPEQYFLSTMSQAFAYPEYPPLVKAHPKDWFLPKHMVSNGPYKLKEWVKNGHLTEVKNPEYWDAKDVHIPTVKFVTPPVTDELNQYKAGEIDMTYSVPSGLSKKQYEKEFGKQFTNVTYLGTYYYWLNMNNPQLKNPMVRKALTMVINRKEIVDNITRLGQTPLYNVVPDAIENGKFANLYNDLRVNAHDTRKYPMNYNWVKQGEKTRNRVAKALLKRAGYSEAHPLTLKISFNSGYASHLHIAESVEQDWKNAFGGMIKTSLDNSEWKVYLQQVNKGNFQVARMSAIADYNSASDFVVAYTCGNPGNSGHVCDHKLDKFYNKAVNAPTDAAYDKYMKQAIEQAMKGYYTIPFYNYTYSRLVKPYVGGYHPENNHMDHVYSKWLYFKKS